jgi:hypothetical protein
VAKKSSSRVWLITLESVNNDPEVISVFNSRRSAKFVREYMEQNYIDRFYSPKEKLAYTKSREENAYPAVYEHLVGVPWHGRITCGHNPFLYGRLVTSLKIVPTNAGEQFEWKELPAPKLQL